MPPALFITHTVATHAGHVSETQIFTWSQSCTRSSWSLVFHQEISVLFTITTFQDASVYSESVGLTSESKCYRKNLFTHFLKLF